MYPRLVWFPVHEIGGVLVHSSCLVETGHSIVDLWFCVEGEQVVNQI